MRRSSIGRRAKNSDWPCASVRASSSTLGSEVKLSVDLRGRMGVAGSGAEDFNVKGIRVFGFDDDDDDGSEDAMSWGAQRIPDMRARSEALSFIMGRGGVACGCDGGGGIQGNGTTTMGSMTWHAFLRQPRPLGRMGVQGGLHSGPQSGDGVIRWVNGGVVGRVACFEQAPGGGRGGGAWMELVGWVVVLSGF
jgi:hypothetical protein